VESGARSRSRPPRLAIRRSSAHDLNRTRSGPGYSAGTVTANVLFGPDRTSQAAIAFLLRMGNRPIHVSRLLAPALRFATTRPLDDVKRRCSGATRDEGLRGRRGIGVDVDTETKPCRPVARSTSPGAIDVYE